MSLKVYKLHFVSPLHLGDVRDDYGISLKTMASDTMYAALTACLAKLGKTVPENGDLGCTISSLYPFYQAEKEAECVLFFPKPLKQTLPQLDIALTERKKIKKVAWLDAGYFSKILRGEKLFDDASVINNAIQGVYMTDKCIDKDFVVSQVVPRVVVSRTGEDAEPFYMERISFKGHSGLYFMAEGDTSLLDEAIKLLQHEGVGTDRNVGNGYFEYETNTVDIDAPEESEYAMALSSFIPETKEQLKAMLDDDNVAYDFQRRGGWITTPPFNTLRKNVVYTFTAGSVFRHDSMNVHVMGRIVDLSKNTNVNHPIWRCGRSLFVPIKIS